MNQDRLTLPGSALFAPTWDGSSSPEIPITAPSIALPKLQLLQTSRPGSAPALGFAVEDSPRQLAFQGALRDFLEVVVRNTSDGSELVPGQDQKARAHFEKMYRSTILSLLLAGDDDLPAVFCLHNSRTVAGLLPDLVNEAAQSSGNLALSNSLLHSSVRSYAGAIWHWTADVAAEVSSQSLEAEVEVFPHLLTLLRDNVLIYAHPRRPKAEQLGGYAEALWGLPGEQFLSRMQQAEDAVRELLEGSPSWISRHLGFSESESMETNSPGLLLRFAQERGPGAPTVKEAAVWEELHRRLRQFDVLDAHRQRILLVARNDDGWVETSPEVAEPVQLAAEQRPFTMFSGGSTGLTVQRFGLRYDITNFSSIMASLELLTTADRESALRRFFFFQRRVQAAARRNGLVMEKHFGDGVLFSSAHSARAVLTVAVEIQRAYRHAVEQGLAFSGGIRLAANWGAYRVVASAPAGRDMDGQLFGPGIVEISRLVSGKVSRDLAEIKKLLVGAGYQNREVSRFFARFEQRQISLVDEATETRRFWAYVNPNGTLVNEGIVITAPFLARLLAVASGGLARVQEGTREFALVDLALSTQEPFRVGISHRGFAEFKGLAPIEVFEVVDASSWGDDLKPVAANREDFSWLPEAIRD